MNRTSTSKTFSLMSLIGLFVLLVSCTGSDDKGHIDKSNPKPIEEVESEEMYVYEECIFEYPEERPLFPFEHIMGEVHVIQYTPKHSYIPPTAYGLDSLLYFLDVDKTVILTDDHIDSLRSIFNGFIGAEWVGSECYEPRHNILFYDQEEALIASVEFCLACEAVTIFPEEYNDYFYLNCFESYEVLGSFVEDIGLDPWFEMR